MALGVIGGALQRYLEAKGEAPAEGSLAAAMPLNMRTRRGLTEDNNQVGSVFASMHTDIADPMERLAAVKQSTEEAKQSGEASPMVDAMKLAGVLSPAITKSLAGFWARNELSRFIPMNVSTCISNVAGPDFPLYCAGAKMVDYYGLGVLTPGMGIFHLVFSYAGKVTLSVLADRDIVPDPELYHDCLVASYEELYAAAIEAAPVRAKSKAVVAAKAKIKSPKRKTPVAKANTAKKTKAKASTRAKAPVKVKAVAKTKAPAKRKAAAKTKAALKSKAPAARRKAKVKATVAAPRVKRRAAVGKAKPKLK